MTKKNDDFCIIFKLLAHEPDIDTCQDYVLKTQTLLMEFESDDGSLFLRAIKTLTQEHKKTFITCIKNIQRPKRIPILSWNMFHTSDFQTVHHEILNKLMNIIIEDKDETLTP